MFLGQRDMTSTTYFQMVQEKIKKNDKVIVVKCYQLGN